MLAEKLSNATTICHVSDLIANSGICALVDKQQVAIFYLPEEHPSLYALSNFDPIGEANVLSRGIVGDLQGQLVVASPLYKQHFCLKTGRCLENESIKVPVWNIFIVDDLVCVNQEL